MKSLINIVPRKRDTTGEIYYQARYFNKSGRLVTSVSFPKKSRSEAYLCAREKLEHIFAIQMTKEEISTYGILSIEEVRAILNLPYDTREATRNTLIALLGITCGLGVSEIRNLEKEHVTSDDMLLIRTTHGIKIVPLIGNVKKRMEKMTQYYPESRYMIPNFKDTGKPCNPISINRALITVLASIGVSFERNIVPSVLWETFLMLLISSHINIEMKTLDYLCGFDIPEADLSNEDKRNVIRAFNYLMIMLEDMKYSALSIMKWEFPCKTGIINC